MSDLKEARVYQAYANFEIEETVLKPQLGKLCAPVTQYVEYDDYLSLAAEVRRLQERCAQLEAKASAHDDEGYELFRGRMF